MNRPCGVFRFDRRDILVPIAFAEAPAFRKAYEGVASHRQTKTGLENPVYRGLIDRY